MRKGYKAIIVREKLHRTIKVKAVKKDKTMIDYLTELVALDK